MYAYCFGAKSTSSTRVRVGATTVGRTRDVTMSECVYHVCVYIYIYTHVYLSLYKSINIYIYIYIYVILCHYLMLYYILRTRQSEPEIKLTR